MSCGLILIKNILDRVNKNNGNYFSNKPEPIFELSDYLSNLVGDKIIYISEFVVAKIKGKIPELNSHPEITDEIFLLLPSIIQFPLKILKDTRGKNKFLFIIANPLLEVVIEIRRIESGKTEINTLHKLNADELKRLERKFPVVS